MPVVPTNVIEPVSRGATFTLKLFFPTLVCKKCVVMKFLEFFGVRGRKNELFKQFLSFKMDSKVIYMSMQLLEERGNKYTVKSIFQLFLGTMKKKRSAYRQNNRKIDLNSPKLKVMFFWLVEHVRTGFCDDLSCILHN